MDRKLCIHRLILSHGPHNGKRNPAKHPQWKQQHWQPSVLVALLKCRNYENVIHIRHNFANEWLCCKRLCLMQILWPKWMHDYNKTNNFLIDHFIHSCKFFDSVSFLMRGLNGIDFPLLRKIKNILAHLVEGIMKYELKCQIFSSADIYHNGHFCSTNYYF